MPSERSPSLGAKYLEMEAQFKRSIRQWARPSPAFKSHTPRLLATKEPYTQAHYDPTSGCIDARAKAASRHPSSAFLSKSAQRPAVALLPTDAMYNPTTRERPKSAAAAAFKSTTPRIPVDRELPPGQQALASPSSGKVSATAPPGSLCARPRTTGHCGAPLTQPRGRDRSRPRGL
jgi:hypothetical protein